MPRLELAGDLLIRDGEDRAAAARDAPDLRERAVYERLKQAGVTEVLGFNIPQFIRADDDLRVIEMSIVTRPFVLDFAGAYLAAKSEREIYEAELNREREALRTNPDAAKEELAIFYRLKGVPEEDATKISEYLAANPDQFLKTMAAEKKPTMQAAQSRMSKSKGGMWSKGDDV